MRTILALVIAASALGCDRWAACDAVPAWSLSFGDGQGSGGSPLRAWSFADGTTLVQMFGRESPTALLDGRELPFPYLARVSADAEVVAIAEPVEYGGLEWPVVVVDSRGRPVVAVGNRLVAYDEDLRVRWSIEGWIQWVGADGGAIAYADRMTQIVHVIDEDGVERWATDRLPISESLPLVLELTDSAELLVYTFESRLRYAAADGALLDEIPWEPLQGGGGSPDFHDGYEVGMVGPANSTLTMRLPSGEPRWTRELPGWHGYWFTPDGDVLVILSDAYSTRKAFVYDADTGETLASADVCEEAYQFLGRGHAFFDIEGQELLKHPLPGSR